jgi:hypothetical protein
VNTEAVAVNSEVEVEVTSMIEMSSEEAEVNSEVEESSEVVESSGAEAEAMRAETTTSDRKDNKGKCSSTIMKILASEVEVSIEVNSEVPEVAETILTQEAEARTLGET